MSEEKVTGSAGTPTMLTPMAESVDISLFTPLLFSPLHLQSN